MDTKALFFQSVSKFLPGVILVGLLLFLSAGSLQFWQGWLLMGILFVPMFCAGLVMILKNPDLLRKRLDAREEEKEQKTVVKFSGLLFVAAFVVAGLGWRFGWCRSSRWLCLHPVPLRPGPLLQRRICRVRRFFVVCILYIADSIAKLQKNEFDCDPRNQKKCYLCTREKALFAAW